MEGVNKILTFDWSRNIIVVCYKLYLMFNSMEISNDININKQRAAEYNEDI